MQWAVTALGPKRRGTQVEELLSRRCHDLGSDGLLNDSHEAQVGIGIEWCSQSRQA